MAEVLDVATYILDKQGSASTMKLQKLAYYSQALHLVTYGSPLFSDSIEAWANGPVIPTLFQHHRGEFVIRSGFFKLANPNRLSAREKCIIDRVLQELGAKSGAELSQLTHNETPWLSARGSLPRNARCSNRITPAAMRNYYMAPSFPNPVFS